MSLSPEKQAALLLESTWGKKPFPIDPVWIAKQLGIEVKEAKLPDDVYAAIIKDQGKDTVILLSNSDSNNRQRFSCAHELGHYVYHSDSGENQYEYLDFRSTVSSSGTSPEEIFANRFAAALLMSEDEVKKLHSDNQPSFLMAYYFGVSDEAINYRLKNLGLTS